MSDDELQRELLNEVPTPQSGYWNRIDDVLHDHRSPKHAADSGPTTGAVADITSTPAVAGSHDDRQRSRGRAWRWPVAAAAAALLLFAGWAIGNAGTDSTPVDLAAQPEDTQPDDAQQDDVAIGPRANRDHWHAVYAVWDCTADDGAGAWLPVFESNVDDYGIHSHGDGLIAIHPFFESSAGANAQFGLFAESMGIDVAVDAITLDDGRRLESGTDCGGEPAVVHLRRWQYDFQLRSDPSFAPTIVTDNFNQERFFNDREVWVIAFAPLDADLPLVPQERFDELEAWSAPQNILWHESFERRRTPPPADLWQLATTGLGDGPLAQELRNIRRDQNQTGDVEYAPVESAAAEATNHVATVQTGSRALDIFRSNENAPPYCLSIYSTSPSRPGTAFTCGSEDLAPRIDVVRGLQIAAIATYAPEDAQWMLIEADDGFRIIAEVVDGIAFAEWLASAPFEITLIDAEMNTVFTYEAE